MSELYLLGTPLAGLLEFERKPAFDKRGQFQRLFDRTTIEDAGIDSRIEQINLSITSHKGTIRGLHFQQAPFSETKIVGCIHGSVFDVTVDLRSGSPTFLEWHAVIMSSDNLLTLVIPPGFAHGFQTLVEDSYLVYSTTNQYQPSHEGVINPFEARVGIKWPLPPVNLSEKDSEMEMLPSDWAGLCQY